MVRRDKKQKKVKANSLEKQALPDISSVSYFDGFLLDEKLYKKIHDKSGERDLLDIGAVKNRPTQNSVKSINQA